MYIKNGAFGALLVMQQLQQDHPFLGLRIVKSHRFSICRRNATVLPRISGDVNVQ
jgi:DNA-directed RNA polymerase beta' subunit